MGKKLLQVNFRTKRTKDDLLQAYVKVAKPYSEAEGLEWKIWLYDEKKRMGGGIYLFKDQASVDALLKSKLYADTLLNNPNTTDVDIKIWDVATEAGKVTKSPI